MKMIFVVDLDRCIGCKGCQVACKMENDVPLGANRTMVYQVGPTGTYPELEMYFLPSMCQQCENPSCVDACPTGACYKNEADGIVIIDPTVCVGCGLCRRACPYENITVNPESRVMDKCTMCMQLRSEGDAPACVKNCAGKALAVGDIDDPNSTVSRMLAEVDPENVHSLRDFGNHPTTRYILRGARWQDVMPSECRIPGRRGKAWKG